MNRTRNTRVTLVVLPMLGPMIIHAGRDRVSLSRGPASTMLPSAAAHDHSSDPMGARAVHKNRERQSIPAGAHDQRGDALLAGDEAVAARAGLQHEAFERPEAVVENVADFARQLREIAGSARVARFAARTVVPT